MAAKTKRIQNEWRLRNIHPSLKTPLDNIAKWHGVPTPTFIKMELKKLVELFPEHIKNPDN